MGKIKHISNSLPNDSNSDDFDIDRYKLISSSSEYILITDVNDKVTWANDGFTRLTGYTLNEVLGKKPSSFLRGKETHINDSFRIDSKAHLRIPFKEEALNYKKNGSPIWLSFSVIPIFTKGNAFEGFITIGSDITHIKRNEELLRQNSTRLNTINSLLSTLLQATNKKELIKSLGEVLLINGFNINAVHFAKSDEQKQVSQYFYHSYVGNNDLRLLNKEQINEMLRYFLIKPITYLKNCSRIKTQKIPTELLSLNKICSLLVIPIAKGDGAFYFFGFTSEDENAFNDEQVALLSEIRQTLLVSLKQLDLRSKLETKQKQIEEKNKEITDSIQYAQKIQSSILPERKQTVKLLPNSFVYYKPKDIVSGDYYWLTERNDRVYFTAADCTGHGVPGAFMSLIGTSLLNQIVKGKKYSSANEILNELRTKVINTLRQNEANPNQKDGMDMGFCVWDKMKYTLEFSGANNNLVIIRNHQAPLIDLFTGTISSEMYSENNVYKLFELRGDRQPIGISGTELRSFHNHEFKLHSGDTIYLFSDGITDQFGGPKGKKLLSKNLKRFLLSIQHHEMKEQEKLLSKFLNNWKGTLEQTDDILIIGARF